MGNFSYLFSFIAERIRNAYKYTIYRWITQQKTTKRRVLQSAIKKNIFHAFFRKTEVDNVKVLPLSSTEIFQRPKKHNPSAIRGTIPSRFGIVLKALGTKSGMKINPARTDYIKIIIRSMRRRKTVNHAILILV